MSEMRTCPSLRGEPPAPPPGLAGRMARLADSTPQSGWQLSVLAPALALPALLVLALYLPQHIRQTPLDDHWAYQLLADLEQPPATDTDEEYLALLPWHHD